VNAVRGKAITEEEVRQKTWSERWLALGDVLDLLAPPVVNPTNLKQALGSAATKDAVIAQAAQAIIDDRWRQDPAIWVVRPRDRDRQKSLYDHDYERLRQRYDGGGGTAE
jgi:hypothetical protein